MQSRNNSQSPTFNISMASVAQSFQQNSKNVMLGMRNINTKNVPQMHPNDTKTWVTTCRQMLIDMESKNIKTRAVFWSQFVNDTTKKTMDKLHQILREANIDCSDYPKFVFEVSNPLKHLRFLAEWTGLKTQQMQYMPKSYTEFEYKAKNWLNGRKAPNYALTLFPEMIHHSESYAEQHSAAIFTANKSAVNLLSTALRYGYLARLCSAKISLNDTGRKTPLLIENSIKTAKSTTSKIFQQYAIDHPYSSQFPSHTSEAATYFEGKYQECLQRLTMLIKCNSHGNGHGHGAEMSKAHCFGPPNNIMPTIPTIPLPTVPMPQIPQIPALSADSHASNDLNNADNNNNGTIDGGSFSFNVGGNQQIFTVSDLNVHQHNNNNAALSNNSNNLQVVSPGSSNSTFNSAQFGIVSPSTSNSNQSGYNLPVPPPNGTFNNINNVLLPARQYNQLVQQLNRLTDTQNSQKDIIHQLLTRIHSLEARIDHQRINQQQFGMHAANQSVSDHFFNTTPSVGYSLAADFANAQNTSNNTPNLNTNTPTTSASDTPPVLNNFQLIHNQKREDGDIDIHDTQMDGKHNVLEHDEDDMDGNQSAMPFNGLMFTENHNDIHMFSANPNINTFPPYI